MKDFNSSYFYVEAARLLEDDFIDCELTGSRIHGDYHETSDYDVLILVEENCWSVYRDKLLQEGWEDCGDYQDEFSNFLIMRKYENGINNNIIITQKVDIFELWKTVDVMCKKFKFSKLKRKFVFNVVINQ